MIKPNINIVTNLTLRGYESQIPSNSGVYVIADKNLSEYYSQFSDYKIIEIEATESKKTLETVAYVVEKLLEYGADRDCFIIGFGGGITTDIAGFVASIYKRGVRFGFVPTTLLAQVDAAIGGKTGVNFSAFKNILGVINQAEFVYCCTEVLQTLHIRHLRAGLAEALKILIIYDKATYDETISYFSKCDYGSLDYEKVASIIDKCARYKCSVVERDEFEKGERRMLNLGHTFAHAVEKLCSEVSHGEAVSIGMVMAARLKPENNDFARQLRADLQSVGLSVDLPEELDFSQVFEIIKNDKKVSGGAIHLILPFDFEDVRDVLVEFNELEEILNDLPKSATE